MGYIWAFPEPITFHLGSLEYQRNPVAESLLLDYIAGAGSVTAAEIKNSGEKSSANSSFLRGEDTGPGLSVGSWGQTCSQQRELIAELLIGDMPRVPLTLWTGEG